MISLLQDKINTMFSDLTFEDRRHLYYWKGEIVPNSVSALVEKHAPKFDEEFMLPHSVKKYNRNLEADEIRNKDMQAPAMTVEMLRKQWAYIRDEACRNGIETHAFMEKFTGIQTPTSMYQRAGIKFFRDYSGEYEILFRELRMYSRNFKYAGTEDLILQHKKTGEIITADYKTNKDLFKQYKGQRLFSPFDTLDATPYNKIQIQLSYYQIMLEEINCIVADRWLIWLKPDGNYRLFKTFNLCDILRKQMREQIEKQREHELLIS